MRKGGLTKWLLLAGAVVLGSIFSVQVKEFVAKIPVIGPMINGVGTTTEQ